MKNKSTFKKYLPLFVTVSLILLIPLIAMQFTDEVNWTVFDFVIAGILLSFTGISLQFIFNKSFTKQQKIIFCGLILLALFIIWIELAVGIF